LSPRNEACLKTRAPVGKSLTDFDVSDAAKTTDFRSAQMAQPVENGTFLPSRMSAN